MGKRKIVIVGGGFAGIKLALDLYKDTRFQITLVSDKTDFQYYPTLYKTASGGRRSLSSIPLIEIFAGKRVNLIHDELKSLDRESKTITTAVNHVIGYDELVLCIGVKTNYFHIKGLKKFSYGMKNIPDAEELKQHLHTQLIVEKRPDLNYVIVGGGPTGVELAGALPGYLRRICRQHGIKRPHIHVDLVEAAPQLLPKQTKRYARKVRWQLRRLGVKVYTKSSVQAQSADALMVNNKPIRSHSVIWTAGVTNHTFFTRHGFQMSHNGKVRVDQFLSSEPHIYVLGDNADTPYSGQAQTALYDAKFLAGNLMRAANGEKLKSYIAKEPVIVIPVGPLWAAFDWRGISFYGLLGSILRQLADLIAYHDYEPWKIAAHRWLGEWEDEESCPLCADDLAKSYYLSGNSA